MSDTGSIDEECLLAAIQAAFGPDRDETAFRLVYGVYYPRLRGFLAKRATSEIAADLTQQTFLRVLQSKKDVEFADVTAFESWLFRSGLNTYFNVVRARSAKKRAASETSLDGLALEVGEGQSPWQGAGNEPGDALTDCIAKEQQEQLAVAIQALPDKMRQCLVYRLCEELSNREIGKKMNISDQTVKAHLYQARQRLKVLLKPIFRGFDEIVEDNDASSAGDAP